MISCVNTKILCVCVCVCACIVYDSTYFINENTLTMYTGFSGDEKKNKLP